MKNCVRHLRRELELSQEDLASAIGVGRHTIIDIEKGEREPGIKVVLRIAQFFGKDPREIFFIDSVSFIQHKKTSDTSSTRKEDSSDKDSSNRINDNSSRDVTRN